MAWTHTQQVHLSIWPHFTGPLSMVGSGLIICEVLRDPKKRRKVYHRLLLAMSICDLNTSLWYSLSTVAIPRGTENVYAPSGTRGTCTAQGFFIQFGIATPLYNAALAIYYLLIVRYQWKEQRIRKAEKALHAAPLAWAAATSLASLGMTLLNNANLWCWIASVPLGCTGSRRNGGVNDCERGDNAWIYRWAFFYGPLWFAIALSGVAMVMTWGVVRKTEAQTDKRRIALEVSPGGTADEDDGEAENRSRNQQRGKRSRQVATQAFFYMLAFFLSWTPATLTRFIQMVWGKTYYPIILMMAIFTPLQGFFNFLVYSRPRWMRFRKSHPEWNFCRACLFLFCHRDDLNRKSSTEHYGNLSRAMSSKRKMASGASRRSSNSVGRKSSLDSVADHVESNDKGASAEAEKFLAEDYNKEAVSDTEEKKQEEGFTDEGAAPPKKTRNPIVSFSKSTVYGSDVTSTS